MGFFSFITNDTNKSIMNNCSDFETETVYLIDDKGNSWMETSYEGYGVFGGKDIFQLFAEMNGISEVMPSKPNICNPDDDSECDCDDYDEEEDEEKYWPNRGAGIDLWYRCKSDPELKKTVVYPNLVHHRDSKWVNRQPEDCPYQGYFRSKEEEPSYIMKPFCTYKIEKQVI